MPICTAPHLSPEPASEHMQVVCSHISLRSARPSMLPTCTTHSALRSRSCSHFLGPLPKLGKGSRVF